MAEREPVVGLSVLIGAVLRDGAAGGLERDLLVGAQQALEQDQPRAALFLARAARDLAFVERAVPLDAWQRIPWDRLDAAIGEGGE